MSDIAPDQIQATPASPSSQTQSSSLSPAGVRTRRAGTVFGAFAGLLLGALLIGICGWLAGFLWPGVLIGAIIGPVGGAVIGYVERTRRGDLVRPDIATIIGLAYGLLPSLLIVLGIGT